MTTLNSCLKCLSTSKLNDLLLLLWAMATGNAGQDGSLDMTQLQADSACNRCLSKKQALEGEVAVFASVMAARYTTQQLLDRIKCIEFLDENIKRGILLWLKCQAVHDGGGGGLMQFSSGPTDPAFSPINPCSAYYNYTTMSFWLWDNAGGVWVKRIA